MTPEEFDAKIASDGWALLEGIVPERIVWEMCEDLDFAYAACRRAQREAGLEETEGTVHHLPAVRGHSFLRFLEANPTAPYVSQFFGGQPYVLQSMGGQFNFPEAANYAAKVHRDVRSFWMDRIMLNTLVTLDDMDENNGATWLLLGGHEMRNKPTDEEFVAAAAQVSAPAGSVVAWDSRLWHRAGVNRSRAPRRIVTPIYSVPAWKQGLDYTRAIGYERVAEFSEPLKQVLGYYARVPATLQEWYRKPEERLYMGSQG